jgi:hypothetical protein
MSRAQHLTDGRRVVWSLQVESGLAFFQDAGDMNPAPPLAPASFDAPNVRDVTLVKDADVKYGFQVGLGEQPWARGPGAIRWWQTRRGWVGRERVPVDGAGLWQVGTVESGPGARVASITPGGLAAESRLLKANDAVLAINGRSMLYATPEEIEDALRLDPGHIALVLADEFPALEELPLQLSREDGTTWGMSLRAFDGRPGTVVRDVVAGGSACRAGVRADDLIAKVRSGILLPDTHTPSLCTRAVRCQGGAGQPTLTGVHPRCVAGVGERR